MPGPLPITLVGGYLGAGKTSLLHHIISEHEGGYLALMVENAGPLNLDARALRGLLGATRRLSDVLLEIPPGDEDDQVEWITARLHDLAAAGRFERVLIEVAGTSSPARLAERLRATGSNGAARAEVQQIICVADALDYLHSSAGPSALLDFQNDLIAGATLVVLNKCDLLEEPQLDLCLQRLRGFHPGARVAQTAYGEVPVRVWGQASSATEIDEAIVRRERPFPPEMPLFGASVYRAYRPFHPQRFFEWFRVEHAGLERVKGIVWLATRSLLVGGISRTRRQSSAGAAGIWWAALPREEWPEDDDSLRAMQATWREPYGDRRQELVLLGEADRLGPAIHGLNACLLRDVEFAKPLPEWSAFPDPFPEWDLE